VTSSHRHGAGIALAVAALACFATLDTTTKLTTLAVPVLFALWFRYLFQAMATTVVMLPIRGLALLRTQHPRFHALRGLLLLLTSLFTFLSLTYMPVGEFTAIAMLTPLVMTGLAATRLGENVSATRWALVSGGFVGTLLIIRPGTEVFQWTLLLPLIQVACYSSFQILTSKMVKTEDPVTMHFYTGWVGTLLASLALPLVWEPPQTLVLWAGLLLMGLMGTVGHFLLILAYQRTTATTLTPFLYVQIGFAMLGGWLVFDHLPDVWAGLGMTLIAVSGACGAWLSVHERRTLPVVADS
jgi:drug/metabolite transporter (DMT)-like permease